MDKFNKTNLVPALVGFAITLGVVYLIARVASSGVKAGQTA